MKRFIRIQSTRTISVAPGLQNVGATNKDAHVGDRMKVNSAWQSARVRIMRGVGYYPACVKTWPSVKTLADLNILSIGEETDTVQDDNLRAEAEKIEKKLKVADNRYKSQLEASINDPLADSKEVAKNKARKKLGLLTPEPAEIAQDKIVPEGN